MPVHLDITIRRGDDVVIELTVTADGQPGGASVDITGWNVEFAIREMRDEPDSIAKLLVLTGSIVTPFEPAVYRYNLSDDDTLALPASNSRGYWWDSRRTDPGNERVLTEGRCVVVNTAGGR